MYIYIYIERERYICVYNIYIYTYIYMDEPLSCTSYNATAPPPRVMALSTPATLAFHSAPVPFAASDRFSHTESAYTVVVQKSIPTQICQLILFRVMMMDKLTDSCGNSLLQNDFINTLCEVRLRDPPSGDGARHSRVSGPPFRAGPLRGCGQVQTAYVYTYRCRYIETYVYVYIYIYI